MNKIFLNDIKNIPNKSGIYQMFDKNDEVLYVGKAKDLKKRLSNYLNLKNNSFRIQKMISQISYIKIQFTDSEEEALILENNMIKRYMPRYNILLRDDKSFPYVAINKDKLVVKKHRGKFHQGEEYYGPFMNVWKLNRAIDVLKRSFLLRSSNNEDEYRDKIKPRYSSKEDVLIKKSDFLFF